MKMPSIFRASKRTAKVSPQPFRGLENVRIISKSDTRERERPGRTGTVYFVYFL